MHKVNCFDLDLSLTFLKGHKNICTMDARLGTDGFDSVRVTCYHLTCKCPSDEGTPPIVGTLCCGDKHVH